MQQEQQPGRPYYYVGHNRRRDFYPSHDTHIPIWVNTKHMVAKPSAADGIWYKECFGDIDESKKRNSCVALEPMDFMNDYLDK